MRARTFFADGIVLKRSSVGETDRVVRLLTQQYGNLTCVAKGVRKINSSNRALLEPGNYVRAFLIKTKSLPLLTQAKQLDSLTTQDLDLPNLRTFSHLLEAYDKLFVQQELDQPLFNKLLKLRRIVIRENAQAGQIRYQLGTIIEKLGYQHPEHSSHQTVTEYIEALTGKQMNSFRYLRVDASSSKLKRS